MSAGSVYLPSVSMPDGTKRETKVWWLKYSVRGQRYRESSKTTSKTEAQRKLRDRLGEREDGKVVGCPANVTVQMLRQGLEDFYERQGRRSTDRMKAAMVHIVDFYKADRPVIEIRNTGDYITARLKEKAAPASIKYELSLFRKAFTLAMKTGQLAARPYFEMPEVHNAREGFFTEADIAALMIELPAYLRPVLRFGQLTGWRRQEVVGLTWDAVDWEREVIRLRAGQSKSKKGRVFPFGLAPDLKALMREQWSTRDGAFVFHRNGKPLLDFYAAWRSACERAGMKGRLFHDLRRSAARDLRKAGVSEGDVMKLCGWETRAMFDRYNIIDEDDLAAAVAKRFAGQVDGQTKGKHSPKVPAEV